MRALEDHEIVAMTQQYTQALDGTYITHIAARGDWTPVEQVRQLRQPIPARPG